VYIENAGDFELPLDAVKARHSESVIFHSKLEPGVREGIDAHDAAVSDL